ncbi:chorismate lyase, partial [Pseudomonas sp. BEA3.1]|uniref:chorismate lyase n=1 Tax=Pseudomonas sp. BEA3.1 TaxID=3083251 RepID=UPI0029641E22
VHAVARLNQFQVHHRFTPLATCHNAGRNPSATSRSRPLRDDECQALGIAAGAEGWVREVYLRGHGQPWVFARSVASRSALERGGLDLESLGSRSLGELLFCDQAFIRHPLEVCTYPQAWLPSEAAHAALWGRRSRFERNGLDLLVAEVFLPALWQAAKEENR